MDKKKRIKEIKAEIRKIHRIKDYCKRIEAVPYLYKLECELLDLVMKVERKK